jgi:hypothetical protein
MAYAPNKTNSLEKFLAVLAAIICLAFTGIIWWSISAHQAMWPLPGLYFLELVALSMLSIVVFVYGRGRIRVIPWIAAGVFLTFAILGALSVGPFYLPVALIYAGISITSDIRNKQPILAHMGISLAAALVQAALMLLVIRWL